MSFFLFRHCRSKGEPADGRNTEMLLYEIPDVNPENRFVPLQTDLMGRPGKNRQMEILRSAITLLLMRYYMY